MMTLVLFATMIIQLATLSLAKPPGLSNQSLTKCYQNSVLQVLHLTSDFKDTLNSQKDLPPLEMTLRNLLNELDKEADFDQRTRIDECILELQTMFASGLLHQFYNLDEQHDAAEFLSDLLRHWHGNEFSFTLSTQWKFPSLNGNDHEFTIKGNTQREKYTILTLPIHTDQIWQLKDLIEFYQKPEIMDDPNNLPKHPQTGQLSIAEQTQNIIETGKYVIIQLMRMDKQQNKILNHVHINEEITLNDQQYRLYGAIFHEGWSLNSGHYWTIAQESNQAAMGGHQWWKFNDQNVRKSSLNDIIKIQQSEWVNPYLLFFVKKDPNYQEQPQPQCDNYNDNDDCDEEYSIGKPMGLRKKGDTCYRNAVFQMLHLSYVFKSIIQKRKGMNQVFDLMAEIFTALDQPATNYQWYSDIVWAHQSRLKEINDDQSQFTLPVQQDAAKFLRKILELSQAHRKVLVTQLTKDSVLKLILSDDDHDQKRGGQMSSVQGLIDAKKTRNPSKKNHYLFIQLDRFKHGSDQKIMAKVDINERIVVYGSEYVLYAVIVHQGSHLYYGGKYQLYGRKDQSAMEDSSDWWLFDNSHVRETLTGEIESLLHDPESNASHFNPPVPYLLAYRRVSS